MGNINSPSSNSEDLSLIQTKFYASTEGVKNENAEDIKAKQLEQVYVDPMQKDTLEKYSKSSSHSLTIENFSLQSQSPSIPLPREDEVMNAFPQAKSEFMKQNLFDSHVFSLGENLTISTGNTNTTLEGHDLDIENQSKKTSTFSYPATSTMALLSIILAQVFEMESATKYLQNKVSTEAFLNSGRLAKDAFILTMAAAVQKAASYMTQAITSAGSATVSAFSLGAQANSVSVANQDEAIQKRNKDIELQKTEIKNLEGVQVGDAKIPDQATKDKSVKDAQEKLAELERGKEEMLTSKIRIEQDKARTLYEGVKSGVDSMGQFVQSGIATAEGKAEALKQLNSAWQQMNNDALSRATKYHDQADNELSKLMSSIKDMISSFYRAFSIGRG